MVSIWSVFLLNSVKILVPSRMPQMKFLGFVSQMNDPSNTELAVPDAAPAFTTSTAGNGSTGGELAGRRPRVVYAWDAAATGMRRSSLDAPTVGEIRSRRP